MANSLEDNVKKLKVLSDETRLNLVQMLAGEEQCTCDLLANFQISQPTLSYHMKMLKDQELISSRKEGNKTMYSLRKDEYRELVEFMKNLGKINNEVVNK
ncbi:ArsR/SmtB family transcription factor [Lacticigenium naphthae]|uniref:ArsR/SmtB family transcription factor n=1 Tax=Lacticigenium naphthae TaxID=515351 RepID=UPI0003FEED87|nr:metalloregulator ArsR/SmtB family transcription factor [Lacticigenium naphthae]